ncbi:hypothetical protein ACOJBO_02340 [Rhizobium beringeri]
MGTARVDLAALIELNRLVSGGARAALFRGEHRITQEQDDEIRNTLVPASGRQLDLIFKNPHARRTERTGSQEGNINTGLPADAGGPVPGRRGAQR